MSSSPRPPPPPPPLASGLKPKPRDLSAIPPPPNPNAAAGAASTPSPSFPLSPETLADAPEPTTTTTAASAPPSQTPPPDRQAPPPAEKPPPAQQTKPSRKIQRPSSFSRKSRPRDRASAPPGQRPGVSTGLPPSGTATTEGGNPQGAPPPRSASARAFLPRSRTSRFSRRSFNNDDRGPLPRAASTSNLRSGDDPAAAKAAAAATIAARRKSDLVTSEEKTKAARARGKKLAAALPNAGAALRAGRIDDFHAMLKANPDLAHMTLPSSGFSPLHHAAIADHVPLAEALLRTPGIDVNAQCVAGSTPLYTAAAHGSVQVARLLCAHVPRAGEPLFRSNVARSANQPKAEAAVKAAEERRSRRESNATPSGRRPDSIPRSMSTGFGRRRSSTLSLNQADAAPGAAESSPLNTTTTAVANEKRINVDAEDDYFGGVGVSAAGAAASATTAGDHEATDNAHSVDEKGERSHPGAKNSRKGRRGKRKSATKDAKAAARKSDGGESSVSAEEDLTAGASDANGSKPPPEAPAEVFFENIVDPKTRVDARDRDGETPLWRAACNGSLPVVSLLLSYGANPFQTCRSGTSPVWAAAFNGHSSCIEALVPHYYNMPNGALAIHAPHPDGRTPLWVAARRNHGNAVRLLIRCGANVDAARKKDSATPLFAAAYNGNAECVELLCAARADVHACHAANDSTPLWAAVQNGHEECVITLLKYRSDVHAKCINGCTPLWMAAQHNHATIAERLLAFGAAVDAMNNENDSALSVAAEHGHATLVQLLVRRYHATVYSVNKAGFTPLHLAAQNNHPSVVRTLCVHGADVDAVTLIGATPLFLAAQEGSIHVERILLSYGADTNIKRNDDGATALWMAARNGYAKFCRLLCANGAWVDAPRTNGTTPLFAAVTSGHHEVAHVLLRFGANTKIKSKTKKGEYKGETPLRAARRAGNSSKLPQLLRNRPPPITAAELTNLTIRPAQDLYAHRMTSSSGAKA